MSAPSGLAGPELISALASECEVRRREVESLKLSIEICENLAAETADALDAACARLRAAEKREALLRADNELQDIEAKLKVEQQAAARNLEGAQNSGSLRLRIQAGQVVLDSLTLPSAQNAPAEGREDDAPPSYAEATQQW